MENVVIQIRSGKTGEIKKQAAPPVFRKCNGYSANWVHHRILIANLRGNKTAQDFIVKLGHKILAFTDELKLLWDYDILWNEYQHCSAYIPSVGDIDRDGKDEINGGYFLLDDDGTPLWEKKLGMNMDSVAVAEWDEGNIRAFCSGYGHIVDEKGNVILCLGKNVVPHGQELRVGRFRVSGCDEPQMVIRSHGHETKAVVVNNNGKIEYEFELNPSSNNTGMETVRWNGVQGPDLLYNAGMLWNLSNRTEMPLPGLPPARGERVMGWYHCIPADICGDEREELIVYNPWDSFINIYTPAPFIPEEYDRYISGARQYNARFMD
jgi:hypothetical protein